MQNSKNMQKKENTEAELIPGDKIRLIGWAKGQAENKIAPMFAEDGHSFPVETIVNYPNTVTCLNGWYVNQFEFEVISKSKLISQSVLDSSQEMLEMLQRVFDGKGILLNEELPELEALIKKAKGQ
jgi:hypothetical protein